MVCSLLLGRVHSSGCILQPVVPKISPVSHSSKRRLIPTIKSASNSQEKQLRALDSYFQKLHNSTGASSSNLTSKNHQHKAEKSLRSLKDFRNGGGDSKLHSFEEAYFSMKMIKSGGRAKKLKHYCKTKDIESSNKDSSCFYLIGILASINIAVLLFEAASPVRNSDIGLISLPMVYGAKINHLILLGEWWRLLTPMFLHSGFGHVALGCWVLVSFGPQVCRAYGSFPFLLIYVLGGISGNLISFLHTAEPTVGGTGPGFALIGAWLIYETRNKDVLGKEASKSMIDKAIMAAALSFVLSNFGPIDDWAHFGAVLMGIAYGYLTCPTLQVDNASSESGLKEGITLVKQYSDPCKSFFYFSLFILLLASFLFLIQPPLHSFAEAEDMLFLS